jgi:hypothetical protein
MDLGHHPFLKTISLDSLPRDDSNRISEFLSRITSSVIESVTLHIFSDRDNYHAVSALLIDQNSVFSKRSTRLRLQLTIYEHYDITLFGHEEARRIRGHAEQLAAIRESLSELDTQGRLEFI